MFRRGSPELIVSVAPVANVPSMHVFGLLLLQFRRGFRVSPTRGRLGDELQGISAGPSVAAQGASHRPVSVLAARAMATLALVNSDVGGGGECAR
ncbi:MAG: hypothetical protein ACRBN8_44665 [Nannocystales bacterium]